MAEVLQITFKKLFAALGSKPILIVTLGLAVFLTDNKNLTSASSFENKTLNAAGMKKNRLRLPASISSPTTIAFDCKNPQDKIEINTEFETIRLQANNCG